MAIEGLGAELAAAEARREAERQDEAAASAAVRALRQQVRAAQAAGNGQHAAEARGETRVTLG